MNRQTLIDHVGYLLDECQEDTTPAEFNQSLNDVIRYAKSRRDDQPLSEYALDILALIAAKPDFAHRGGTKFYL